MWVLCIKINCCGLVPVCLWVPGWPSSSAPDSPSAPSDRSWPPPGAPAWTVSCLWTRAPPPLPPPRPRCPAPWQGGRARWADMTPWFVPTPSRSTRLWRPPVPPGCCRPIGRWAAAGLLPPWASWGSALSGQGGKEKVHSRHFPL